MTPEEIYDAEIAPALAAVMQRCHALGWPMIAQVEWEPGETGRTETHPPWNVNGFPSSKQRIVHWAARCNGNVDSLILAILRDAEKHGHSSMCLKQLGCENIQYSGNEAAAFTIVSP